MYMYMYICMCVCYSGCEYSEMILLSMLVKCVSRLHVLRDRTILQYVGHEGIYQYYFVRYEEKRNASDQKPRSLMLLIGGLCLMLPVHTYHLISEGQRRACTQKYISLSSKGSAGQTFCFKAMFPYHRYILLNQQMKAKSTYIIHFYILWQLLYLCDAIYLQWIHNIHTKTK